MRLVVVGLDGRLGRGGRREGDKAVERIHPVQRRLRGQVAAEDESSWGLLVLVGAAGGEAAQGV